MPAKIIKYEDELVKLLDMLIGECEQDTEPITPQVIKAHSSDELRLMGLVSSNAFRDREHEIVKSEGLREYARGETPTTPEENKLLFWHESEPIGDIIYAEFYKSFLIEVAVELADKEILLSPNDDVPVRTTIKNVWDGIEATPGQWRTSIGFRAIGKTPDGVIYPIDKFETSVLEKDLQANWYTNSEVIGNAQ